jgi:hypothetical protein
MSVGYSFQTSDGLASFLETTLANGVKVVEKVITSKFRFHLIEYMHWGVFAISAAHPLLYKITLKSRNEKKTSNINI